MSNLTEQWKNGELEEGFYYFKMPDGAIEIASEYRLIRYKLTKDAEKIEVLAPVPSYEEYSRLEWYAGCGPDRIVELNKENRKLKELLKECKGLFNRATVDGAEPNNAELITILNKIDEVLNVAED